MILKVILHLILKKAQQITGSPRNISSENLLEIWQLFGKKTNDVFG